MNAVFEIQEFDSPCFPTDFACHDKDSVGLLMMGIFSQTTVLHVDS